MFGDGGRLRETTRFESVVADSKFSVDRNHRNRLRRDAARWCEGR